jgi:hypothetical protein
VESSSEITISQAAVPCRRTNSQELEPVVDVSWTENSICRLAILGGLALLADGPPRADARGAYTGAVVGRRDNNP